MKTYLLSLLLLVIFVPATAQSNPRKKEPVIQDIVFKDTVHNIAVDSLQHNLGTIKVGRVFIEKSFTYLGEGRVNISNVRTTDAYSSCSYSPHEPLVKGKLYTLQSSLAFVAPCTFSMIHTVELGDGKNIIIRYTGIVVN